jgi:hypothetical protein
MPAKTIRVTVTKMKKLKTLLFAIHIQFQMRFFVLNFSLLLKFIIKATLSQKGIHFN